MSLPTEIGAQSAQRRVDTAPGPGVQDWGPAPHGAGASGARIRSRTLVTLRWLAVVGQTAALLFVGLVLKLPVPWGLGFAVVALSAWLNLILTLTPVARRPTGALDAAGQLAFDIVQLAGFLFLTGGMTNPFAILLIAPATLAASSLPPRHALALGALAVTACVVLTIWSMPLPWFGAPLELPAPYRIAAAAACISGIIFTAGYAWQATAESQRMELALNVTETVLAREQRLSALGGLAAAAAHELGTPLATIAVVAKELARELPEGTQKEDAWLLVAQAQRCRDILKRLTETPDTGDEVHERLTLLQFVKEVVEPYAAESEVRVEALVNGAPGVDPPDMWRRPEILHAMTSIVENAFDFARAEILVTARFDETSVTVEVRDDGPGFSPEVLAKLGEPYVTSRPGAEGSRTGHIGMGLGFFIAKTLLERTGAKVEFRNGRRGGAVVAARWPRSRIEAPTAA